MKRIAGLFITATIASFTTIAIYKTFDNYKQSDGLIINDTRSEPKNIFHYANLPLGPETSVDFTIASQKTVNAVVHVKTVYEGQTKTYIDPFYEYLWGGGNSKYHQYKDPDRHGSGSGVIISADGYIATNNHVIKGADNIEVTLNNKRTYSAKIIGVDPSTDIALIKIEETDLPSIRFGNSDEVKVGEWVLAVGNPYNLTSTVTAGIVSAKGRNIDILRDKFKIESFIQTDAAVNPGNSGGALVNTIGDLIGINSAIASPTGSYSGYSFAIPVNMVRKVVKDLQEFGEVQRAFIGVTIQNVDEQMADELGLKEVSGVFINGIVDNGEAKQKGVRKGDIIKKINQVEVINVPELQEQIGKYRPGDKILITIMRDGEKISLPIVLKNRFGNTNIVKERVSSLVLHGATFEPINKGQMKELNTAHGVQITKLGPGKLKKAGIKEGFVITRIDRRNIENTDEVATALNYKKGGVLIEGIYPDGIRAYYGFGI
ncbi:MAG TPA: Do family serine endopeptidase [Flavobacteriales bacterium]|nr:Do family serine endopeptidase [Flavobacteriales bacterium]HIN39818.1 Do family serine endopeptidase [Flavobacteriales bacterium]